MNVGENGLRKTIRGVLMVSAMLLLASLVHMMIHYADTMDESSKLILGQTVIGVLALLATGWAFYFGKQSKSDEE